MSENEKIVNKAANEIMADIYNQVELMQKANKEGKESLETKLNEGLSESLKQYESLKNQIDSVETKLNRPSFASKPEEDNCEYKKAFASYLRKGQKAGFESLENSVESYIKSQVEKEYKGTESKSVDLITKTLREGIGPNGGYLVVPQRGEIKIGQYFESTPMRQLANVVSMTSNEIDYPIDFDEAGGFSWGTEITSPSEGSTPKLKMEKLTAHENIVEYYATQSMLDDVPNIENWLLTKIREKRERQLNAAYVNGDGAGKPKGFLSYGAWSSPSTIAGATGTFEYGKLEQVASGSSGALTADGLKTLQASLKENYQGNANFLMRRMTFNAAALLKDANNNYLLNTRMLKEGVFQLELLGRPVVFANDMPVIAADALAVAYGDFKQSYTVGERLGLRILRQEHNFPKIRFIAFGRDGGMVTNFEGIKLLKLSN